MLRRGRPPYPQALTPAEARVHALVKEGASNAEIAARLGISVNTVRYHVSNLLSKASLPSRQELAQWEPPVIERKTALFPFGLFSFGHRLSLPSVSVVVPIALVLLGLLTGVVLLSRSDRQEADQSVAPIGMPGPDLPRQAPKDSPGVLLIDYGERPGWDSGSPGAARGALVAVDGGTSGERIGWGPINAGHAMTSVVSPDGRTIAISRYGHQAADAIISALDVSTGLEIAGFNEPAGLTYLTWSPDSRRLYGLKGNHVHQVVWALDIAHGTGDPIGSLDFDVVTAEISPDGAFLYLLAFRAERCCGVDIQGAPFVAAVDLRSGVVVSEISLPHLVAGQRLEPVANEREDYIWRRPDTAISLDGSRLFIAHADSAEITVVDLVRRRVLKTKEPVERSSLLRRAGNWLSAQLVSTASAKSGLTYTKQLVVSPDGKWLYVTGTKSEYCPEDEFPLPFPCLENVPIGLQVVEAATLDLVASFDGIGEIVLSPDGETLLGWSSAYDYRARGEWAEVVPYGPIVIDSQGHRVRHEMSLSEPLLFAALSSDGRYAYVISRGPDYYAALLTASLCRGICSILQVIDLSSGDVLEKREMASAGVSLIGLVANR